MMKNMTKTNTRHTRYYCFRNSLAPCDILSPMSVTSPIFYSLLLLMTLGSSDCMRILLSASQFQTAHRMPSPEKTKMMASDPPKDSGANPSGVEDPSILDTDYNPTLNQKIDMPRHSSIINAQKANNSEATRQNDRAILQNYSTPKRPCCYE